MYKCISCKYYDPSVDACNADEICYVDGYEKAVKERKSATKMIEQVRETICDHFCVYRDTCDDNCECEWIRNGNECPLDRL